MTTFLTILSLLSVALIIGMAANRTMMTHVTTSARTDAHTQFLELLRLLEPAVELSNESDLAFWRSRACLPPEAGDDDVETRAKRAAQNPEILGALSQLMRKLGQLPPLEAAIVRRLHECCVRDTALTPDFMERQTRAVKTASTAWRQAVDSGNFSLVVSALGAVFDLARQEGLTRAGREHWNDSLYDQLVGTWEPGSIDTRAGLVQLRNIAKWHSQRFATGDTGQVPDPLPTITYDHGRQDIFCRKLVGDVGFDLARGDFRLCDVSYAVTGGPNDVKVLARYSDSSPLRGIFATLQEGFHGTLMQGVPDTVRMAITSAYKVSMAIHEAVAEIGSSRLGRSREFWVDQYPKLQQTFPELNSVSFDDFYTHISDRNRQASHAFLSTLAVVEIELQMLSRRITARDIPRVYGDLVEAWTGSRPTEASVIQVAKLWCDGMIGYRYAALLADLATPQLWAKFQEDCPDYAVEFSSGDFSALHRWLSSNVFPIAYTASLDEVLLAATGRPLSAEYARHIWQ
ncbi:MAG: hypothetical protein V1685_04595 [Parcubacteria group bacterium]